MNNLVVWIVTAALMLVGCDSLQQEQLLPLTGDETRYLAFQIFVGTEDTWRPWVDVVHYTPADKVAMTVREIVDTVGTRGRGKAKLAVIIGPIAPDHTDAEAQQTIDDAFSAALANDVAVGIHLDDSMFWSRRPELMADPASLEKVDWAGPSSTALALDWAKPPAKLCLNAPAIRAEISRRARMVIGPAIAKHLVTLKAQGKEQLVAGVIAGWETHMGRDPSDKRLGFCALKNRGFSAAQPPSDLNAEIASIVEEHITAWTTGLAAAGISPDRIYSHVAFLPRAKFEKFQSDGMVPPGIRYEDVLDAQMSTQRPSIAFGASRRAGFTTYPDRGVFEQIYDEVSQHNAQPWASTEGTNVLPGQSVNSSGIDMETYLARSFNHGAALVDVFGWGIGGPSAKTTNLFRVATESDAALAAYRKFLDQ